MVMVYQSCRGDNTDYIHGTTLYSKNDSEVPGTEGCASRQSFVSGLVAKTFFLNTVHTDEIQRRDNGGLEESKYASV